MIEIDIEMPKSCMCCQVSDSVPDCPCKGNTLIFDYRDKRHPDCPLVEVEERKVGKWIYDSGSYKCPFCEHEITGKENDLNYCCKCGAEMRLNENE